MRTAEEIREEIDKVYKAKQSAIKKIKRCLIRIDQLEDERKEAEECKTI